MTPHVKIAITMDNDSLAVMLFVIEGRSPTLPVGAEWLADGIGLWRRPATEGNIAVEIQKAFPLTDQLGRRQPQPVRWKIVTEAELPPNRVYRNAWRHDGKKIYHDMPHARKIHLEQVRQARLEQLGKLDRDWMRATGRGGTAEAALIEAKREALRNLPTTLPLESAKTVEELKALWPEDLPRVD